MAYANSEQAATRFERAGLLPFGHVASHFYTLDGASVKPFRHAAYDRLTGGQGLCPKQTAIKWLLPACR